MYRVELCLAMILHHLQAVAFMIVLMTKIYLAELSLSWSFT